MLYGKWLICTCTCHLYIKIGAGASIIQIITQQQSSRNFIDSKWHGAAGGWENLNCIMITITTWLLGARRARHQRQWPVPPDHGQLSATKTKNVKSEEKNVLPACQGKSTTEKDDEKGNEDAVKKKKKKRRRGSSGRNRSS